MSRSYRANGQGHKKPERSPQPARADTRRTADAEALRTPRKASYEPAALHVRMATLHQEIAKTHMAYARAMEDPACGSQSSAPTEVEPWIGVDQAAEHLCCPVSRLYRLRVRADGARERNPLPFVKEGNRLLFKRSELDAWARAGGAQP